MEDSNPDHQWVRLLTPLHIPRHLIEQIKERPYSVDDFYKWHADKCLSQDQNELFNPLNHLYGLLTLPPEPQFEGFIWFTIEPLTKNIWIQSFSISPKLWNKGCAISLARDLVLDVRSKAGLNKVYWLTEHPKYHERQGFVRSKTILMEYGGEDG